MGMGASSGALPRGGSVIASWADMTEMSDGTFRLLALPRCECDFVLVQFPQTPRR
jgi:hypothetical protein